MNLHPGVAFTSVMLGSALFGVGGALLAIPVTAMLMAVADAYVERRHLVPDLVTGELATTADSPGEGIGGGDGGATDDGRDDRL